MMRRNLVLAAALVLGACGGDDDGTSVIDASSVIDSGGGGGSDGNTSDIDASGGGGTQGVNQFCETLENGGPYCMEGLDCCDDHVCRHNGDCSGGPGFIPCECTADCPTGLCCDVGGAMDEFCTKRSACSDYDGTEDTTCP